MVTVADIVEHLDGFAPCQLAAEWDNVGLLLGERAIPVERVMTCLTVTSETAGEACDERVQLIVTHHPILFRGVKRLTDAAPEGRMLLRLARAGVAVYSPHTAFDNTVGGINDLLAARLGLIDVGPLRRPAEDPSSYKMVVFVPDADLARVSDALFAAGAGRIGQYRECGFRLAGTGTFFGTEATNPTVGRKGQREEVEEWRLEVVCPAGCLEGAVAALRKAHSYEEPAYDIYPLRNIPSCGEGRLGTLPRSQPLGELASGVRRLLGAGPVQVIGETGRPVRKVAIVCGAGGELLTDAVRAGADLFLTGEMRFHDYLAAQAHGIALILPGHYATERCGVEDLARRLGERWPDLRAWASYREADPVFWV
jgi:dinuclear metal center YbgI/SA1388 family protein